MKCFGNSTDHWKLAQDIQFICINKSKKKGISMKKLAEINFIMSRKISRTLRDGENHQNYWYQVRFYLKKSTIIGTGISLFVMFQFTAVGWNFGSLLKKVPKDDKIIFDIFTGSSWRKVITKLTNRQIQIKSLDWL